jgi:acid phosphatase type 7
LTLHPRRFFCLVTTILLLTGNLCAQQILVRPYVQPGNASTLSKEQKVLIWQTDSVPGNFAASCTLKGSPASEVFRGNISTIELKMKGGTTRLYRTVLDDLQFDTTYYYEVSVNNKSIARDSFRTRTKKPFTRFAVMGDFGAGTRQEAAIAKRIAQQKPQFVLTTGDNVYPNGLEESYRMNLFPYYLPQENEPTKGASLMNTVPFYMILGNHDVKGDSLNLEPGGLAYFYYNDLPRNAPVTKRTVSVYGNSRRVNAFKKNTEPRFPGMSNFSFDYGNVHITCLDANDYVNPLDPLLVDWLMQDIGQSKADWKIVAFHNPGFSSSHAHYDEQHMRLLSPLFEKLNVNLVLTGHVHNYQRSVPLLFAPHISKVTHRYSLSSDGKVNGTFTLDNHFDGNTHTTPKGIIYIVTGAGGGGLYDRDQSQKPELWIHGPKENWAPFTVKLIADRHSFTWIETKGQELVLQQIDLSGQVIDQIRITK